VETRPGAEPGIKNREGHKQKKVELTVTLHGFTHIYAI
jgi:hypothetical protein